MATIDFGYTIYIDDPVLVAKYQALYPNGLTGVAPATAATTYNAQLNPTHPPSSGAFITTGGLDGGTAGLLTTVASVSIPLDSTVDYFGDTVSVSGAPAITLQWKGFFAQFGAFEPLSFDEEALQTHRWINGFEMPNQGEGESAGNPTQRMNRAASRANTGMGLALRSPANEGVTMTMPVTSKYSWERFYIRVKTLPTANEMFWGCKGSVEAGTAALLALTPSGQVVLYNKGNQVYPGTLIATGGTIARNVWTRVDIIVSFATTSASNGDGFIVVYLNGVEAVRRAYPFASGGGGGLFASAQNHNTSYLGNENTPSTGLEIDYDDWTNKTQPVLFTGRDWRCGNHIYKPRLTGFDTGGQGSWVGDYQTLDGVPVIGQTDYLSTVTPSDTIKVLIERFGYPSIYGCAVAAFFKTAATVAGTVGYSIDGAAYTYGAVTATSNTWTTPVTYSAGGQVGPRDWTTLGISYVRNASAVEQDLNVLQVELDCPAYLGKEDADVYLPDSASVAPMRIGPHNSPYESTLSMVSAFERPASPVEAYAGTYTGNGTGQDIDMKIPAHWIWIRPTSVVGNGGSRWWSSMMGGHDPLPQTPVKGNLVRCFFDSSNNSFKFRVAGNAANSNQNGVTYQFVAFSDLGMRFLINGAYLTVNANASFTHNLVDASFTPEALWLWAESGAASATTGVYYKGSGASGANAASPLDGAESATICAMGAGTLTPKATINLASSQTAYSAWRTSDGTYSGVVGITNYTGDGTGARNIAVSLGGRSPLFAMVTPHNGASYFRDPSHTGATSQAVNGSATSATAITGGTADQISVDVTLNALGVVYDVFVIAGTTQSGWSPNPASPIINVPTTQPTGGAWAPSLNGWWTSTEQFTGNATLITNPPLNPHDGRAWDKIAVFAAGNAAYYGGFPGPATVFDNNFLVYAGNDYSPGGTQPTIRIFDGTSDRLLITIPDVAGVKALCVVSMLAVGGTIYLTTLDSGTSVSTWTGRVFALDPIALTLTQLGAQFTGGDVPYALCWHMNRLFLGTNRGFGTNTGRVLWFRPGIDTSWTQDYTLTTSAVGGVLSMASYNGLLYVGTDNDAAHGAAKILVRSTAGAYTTAFTATNVGTARANNGFGSMCVFNGKLYAGYWNPDTAGTIESYIMRFDNASWVKIYTGAGSTIKPYLSIFQTQNIMFVVGGGSGYAATLLSTPDGATYTDLSGFLPNNSGVTSTPLIGVLGV